jgi:GMP synthase-like glutamine amidotransferase
MRPVALLQHEPNQRPGFLRDFLNEAGIPSVTFQPADGDSVPRSPRDFSGLVVLGSAHSVNDRLGWIDQEVALVQAAMAADIPVLGHCFGGQLMARALGATVQRNPCAHIGWSRLRVTPDAQALFGAADVVAFNWHYEGFAIPRGARRTLFGAHSLNKGFAIGKHLAFQCHFEVTERIVRDWCDEAVDELHAAAEPAVQSRDAILARLPQWLPALRQVARRVYAQWAAGLVQGRGQDRVRDAARASA